MNVKQIVAMLGSVGLSALMLQPAYATNKTGFKKAKTEDAGSIIYYKGETTLKGIISVTEPDDEYTPCSLCFFVDEKEYKKIPRAKGDDREPWFTFDNARYNEGNKTYQVLGLKVRSDKCYQPIPATIKIRNYKEDMRETETVDETTLIKIVSMGTPKVIPCTSD